MCVVVRVDTQKKGELIQDISHVLCKSIAVNLEYSLTLYRHLLALPLLRFLLPLLSCIKKTPSFDYIYLYYPLPLKALIM